MRKLDQSNIWKYILYTICFWGFIGPLIYKISKMGLATIGTSDAISQIYPIMMYTRGLLKELLSSLFNGEVFSFPMMEWSLGMGEDTLAALNWHGFGDPFYLLTIFVPEQYMPYFYSVLFYLRVYLGGIVFILFVHDIDDKRSNQAYVVGALVYSFTGFTLQSNMHPIFIHAMIYTPLMLLGAENIRKGRRRGLLCLTTFLFALCGFYFLYIGSISLAVYVIYRMIRTKTSWKEAISRIGIMIMEYLLGLGASAFIFIPGVIGFLTSDRASVKLDLPLVYSWQEIKHMMLNLFLPSYNSEQELAVCTIGVLCAVWILTSGRKYVEKLNLGLLFLTTIIPAVSCIMSGFGECYGRWEFVVNAYLAYLVIVMWDDLFQLSWIQRATCLLLYLALGVWGRKEDILEHERFGVTILTYGLILLGVLVVLPISKRLNKIRIGYILLFVLVVGTICKDWRTVARDREIEVLKERDTVSELLGDELDGFYRIDNERGFCEPRTGINISLILDYPGISEYVSMENNSYATAFEKWGIAEVSHNNKGIDQRAVLETMCAVKYYVGRTQSSVIVPFGFEEVKVTEDGEWALYENKYALPMAYTYDKIFDEDIYKSMTGLERQRVILEAAAVEGYQGELEQLSEITQDLQISSYIVDELQGGTISDGIMQVEAGGILKLTAELKANSENYLYFDGPGNYENLAISVQDGYTKWKEKVTGLAVTLGRVEEDCKKQITITFNEAVTMDMDSLKVAFYDFEGYGSYVDALSEDTRNHVSVANNSITCNLNLKQEKIVCFSVPYSSGWIATVDGVKAHIYRVNDMFMGIDVPTGSHNIELHYVTPGLRIGIFISVISMTLIVGYFIIKKRTGTKDDKKEVRE